ncbi:MAG: ATP-binding cassette domain-containing protein [Kiritimatiellia bacterium]
MIELEEVRKSFDGGSTYAVDGVSLTVEEDETLVLLGSSGCGKTTTLKMINRLIELSGGIITVDGRNIMDRDEVELRRSIGYVFQGIGLFPHMTVEENIETVPRLLGWDRQKRRDRSRKLMELVKLPPDRYGSQYPDQLSGGQKQRVGVARGLAADPKYLLMDEPFGALDALTRDELQQEFLSLKREISKSIIFVTHDIFEALTLADRVAVMHEGRLEQVGTKDDILQRPASDFVKSLFEKPANQLKQLNREASWNS